MNAERDDFMSLDGSNITLASIDAKLQANKGFWFVGNWTFARRENGCNDVEYEVCTHSVLHNDILEKRGKGRTLLEAYHDVLGLSTSPSSNDDCAPVDPTDEIASLKDIIKRQREVLERFVAYYDTMLNMLGMSKDECLQAKNAMRNRLRMSREERLLELASKQQQVKPETPMESARVADDKVTVLDADESAAVDEPRRKRAREQH